MKVVKWLMFVAAACLTVGGGCMTAVAVGDLKEEYADAPALESSGDDSD